jgi:polysaccharide export outer membrane protein
VSRIRAFSLASFHAIATSLIGSAMLTSGFATLPKPVNANDTESQEWLSQESIPVTPAASSPAQQLEDAQQRLLNPSSIHEADGTQQLDPEFDLYRLGPGDSFFVNVQRFPEANFQGTLDLQGNVIVPLVGIMSLQGLTLEQARASIQTQLSRFYVDPVVGLTLVVQRPVQVTVLGEVVRPGLYPLATPQLSLALLSAGGSTRLANLKSIQVRRTLRDSSGGVVDYIEQNIDLFTALADGQELSDIRLSDGDVIIIPALTPAEAAQYDRGLIARSNLAQPSINIRVLSRPQSIGNVVLPNGSNFLDAITAISPEQATSNLREVALIRYVPETGEVERLELSARDALRGDPSQNPLLEHNDIIVIGRNLIGRITNALNTFTQPFRDVLGFLLFFDTLSGSAESLFQPSNNDD